MRGYLTPDSIPAGITCRVLFIPDDRDWIAQVYGAIQELTFPSAWTQYGALTPEETAAVYQEMFFKLLDNERGCRMLGEIILWAGGGTPSDTGLLLCDGATYDRVDYPDLYDTLDAAFIVDADHFIVPDLVNRVPVGAGDLFSVGDIGGETDHTLSVAEIPAHSHTTIPHTHTEITAVASLAEAPVVPIPSAVPGVGVTGSSGVTVDDTGGDEAHNNMQPYLALRYYIQAR